MEIKELRLSNFRCFGPKETVISFTDITTFVGLNSSGKTAILHALLKLFAKSASARELKRADFHIKKGENPESVAERELYIEVVIVFPELIDEDSDSSSTVPPFFEEMVINKPGEDLYVRMRLEAKWKRSNVPDGDVDQRYFFLTVPANSNIEHLDEYKRPVNANHRANIEIIYVPAIRDPISQLKNASGTILWRVWNGISWPTTINEPMKNVGKQVEDTLGTVEGFNTLQRIMGEQWRGLHTDARYSNIDIRFDSVDLKAILQKLEVRFSPTVEPRSYKVDELGEGLRSLFYLSLVNSLLELEAFALNQRKKIGIFETIDNENSQMFNHSFSPPALTILAIEEPENHLAPHLLGRVMQTLHTIANRTNAQVVVTSHTSAIVKRIDPKCIRHLRMCKEKLCTIANAICLPSDDDEAYKYVKEAVWAYPEIYFARLVVLGEGDTEEIVLPKALELLNTTLDGSGISVVPLGGRYVNHFWRLLTELDIPYVTLLDLDLGRATGGWARIKYVVKQLVENGTDAESLLQKLNEALENHNISMSLCADDIETLHSKEDDRKIIESLLDVFANYDIFFASPLDMDFMMLEAFTDEYQTSVEGGYGPRIPNEDDQERLIERLESGIKTTLKTDKPNIGLYTKNEQSLMMWYSYLFLSRNKPGTHILALSKIEDEDFSKRLPQPLKNLISRVKVLFEDDSAPELVCSGTDL